MKIIVEEFVPRDHRWYSFSYDYGEDFITEVGAEAWEQGLCIDSDDLQEAVEFAKETLGWQVSTMY
jgi:hypothetical protein